MSSFNRQRRAFLRQSFTGAGLLVIGGSLYRCGGEESTDEDDDGVGGGGGPGGQGGEGGLGQGGQGQGGQGGSGQTLTSNIPNLGPLNPPDANGVRLPDGFTSRIVARSGESPTGSSFVWHGAPDGGAVFPTGDGGWIYVSNAELNGSGGASALVFSSTGEVIDAYSILTGTSRNCAGGPTPWGTWLSCEEVGSGQVYECDPFGVEAAVAHPALGIFKHEAAAIDPDNEHVYLTEDESDGRLYRFTPAAYPDLSAGTMEVLQVLNGAEGATQWLPLPDPLATSTDTRLQVPQSTAFAGGEGIWFHDGVVYFSTKGDNHVWAYETATGNLSIIYSGGGILSGVDNVVVSAGGDVLVAEDGGDLEIVAVTPSGALVSVMQLVGHGSSEITGPDFDPSRQRLYFSSQRGTTGSSYAGVTFEITGPFFV